MAEKKQLRCAVYTRKSSDEGLDQTFNSLHAQREACEAYVASQKHEGWKVLKTLYDDGGFSGGSLKRPGMQQLLDDVVSGQIDVVVVYKVDRLTRSLSDFARIVETFEKHSVSFVSVTQAFNTTTSMGRLTLNVLLSFAQFEREVTGERIRDKIAASKAKGMWMGGPPPLGYDAKDRRLVINEVEAEQVRTLYRLFLDHKTVDAMRVEADRLGIVSKRRVTPRGEVGGAPMSRGNLYDLLKNPIYVGEVTHRGKRYPGLHQRIIDQPLFDDVQAVLAQNRRVRSTGERMTDPSLLAGILFDVHGRRFTPTHTQKGSRRYRYYALPKEGDDQTSLRLPARDLEGAVAHALESWLQRPDHVLSELAAHELDSALVQSSAVLWRGHLAQGSQAERRLFLRRLVAQVVWAEDHLVISLRLSGFLDRPNVSDQLVEVRPAVRLHRRGADLKIVAGQDGGAVARPDPSLLKLVARGTTWFDEVASGKARTFREIAVREKVTEAFVGQLVELAFLAPDLKQMILEGRQPTGLTATRLLKAMCPLPAAWAAQRSKLSDLV